MSLSKEEIQAFNNECKKNFQTYNQRIQTLENQVRQSTEFEKSIRTIQQIQKELSEKNEQGKPAVALFDFKDRSTRQQFRDRLNRLFVTVNSANIEDIQHKLESVNSRIAADEYNETQIRTELKQIQKQSYVIPNSDGKKNEIESAIQNSFGKLKRPRSEINHDPKTEELLLSIERGIRETAASIDSLPIQSWTNGDYSKVFGELKEAHRKLITIQKDIRTRQEELKTAQLPSQMKNHYYSRLGKCWHDQSSCWQQTNLTERSTFIENVTTENFQRFIGQVEEIEKEVESNPSQNQIKKLHSQIIALEKALGKNEQGDFQFPLKMDQRKEFFGRAIACKKRLSDIFNKVQSSVDQIFNHIEQQCRNVYREYQNAQSRHELEKVKKACKELHQIRKDALQKGQLSPRNNHIAVQNINELWMNTDELIKKLAPDRFSIEWLQEAYLRNVQNGWLVFVDQVPRIAR